MGLLVILIGFVLIATGGFIWLSWQPSVRISQITVYGADQSLALYAQSATTGTYFGIIPRDSLFFIPSEEIRQTILAAHPEIAALSIYREGLTGLALSVDERVPIARWCGPIYVSQTDDCYLFDANGYVYTTASSSEGGAPLNNFIVYDPLLANTSPLGNTLSEAATLPAAFQFARSVSALGAPVSSVVLRGDEVDDYVASSTRITYVLGDEQNAYAALSSALPDLNLTNGSLEYVDLRFDGKVYVKKTGS